MKRSFGGLCVVFTAMLVLAACSSSGSSKSSGSTTTKAKSSGESTPGCKSSDTTSKQRMTVDPCTNLTDGQQVTIYGTKFTPGKTVAATECSTTTDNAGSGCDLKALQPTVTTIGSDGTVTIKFTAKKVLESQTPVNCGGPDQCVVSVGELAAGDAERADSVGLKFAP